MPPESLRCKECKTTYPLDARYVCEQCFGPLEVAYAERPEADPAALRRRIQAGPHSLWRYGDFLPVQSPPKGTLPAGLTPLLRADRLAERLGLKELWVKNDAANPTHSFKDRVVSIALARARELGFETIACASTGNLANAVAAHAAAAGLESYVFIPADLEEQKVLATGIYGTNLVAGARQLRRRQPALHRAFRRARVGVREHQHAPLLRRGLQDAGLRDRRAARLRAARPRGRPDRLGLAVHQDRPRLSGVARPRPGQGELPVFNGAQATGCSPVATAFEAGADFCRPVKPDTIAKSLAIGNPADGPYALDLARSSGGSIDSVTDDEIREGIKLLAQTTGIFTETAGGVTTAVLAKLAERGEIDPDERVVVYITGEGLKTLDAARGTFEAWEIEPNVEAFDAGRRRRGAGIDCRAPMATVKIPTQLRSATDGEAQADVDGSTVGEVLDALYERYGELRSRIAEDGGLRRFVNVYVDGEDIRFLDGLDTEVKDGDEVTILPAVAGG